MSDRKIQVFLYGSAISLSVLETAGLKKRAFAPASISGFDLIIQPTANLVEAGDGVVYGILANFTHDEIDKLQQHHLSSLTNAKYQIEPVLVTTRGGKIVPAITFMCIDLPPAFAENSYVDRIMKAADAYGFPKWYVDRINKFRTVDA